MSEYDLNEANIPFHENVDMDIFEKARKILNNLAENGYIKRGKVETGKVYYGYNTINFYVKHDDYYKPIVDNFKKRGFVVRNEPGTISYRKLQIMLDKTGDSIEECFEI